MDEEKKTPVWVWIGLGCMIPVVLIAVVVGAVLFLGYQTMRHVTSDTPEERAASVQKILGCDEIPEGYFAQMSVSIPFIADFAMLGDHPPDPKDPSKTKPGERGFFYFNSIKGNQDQRDVKDLINGKGDPSEFTSQGGIRMGSLELIGRGEFPLGPGTVHYAANRGDLMTHGKPVKGLVNIFYVECPTDARVRFGTWYGPDPKAAEPVATADFSGTTADENALQAFLNQFSLCPK